MTRDKILRNVADARVLFNEGSITKESHDKLIKEYYEKWGENKND